MLKIIKLFCVATVAFLSGSLTHGKIQKPLSDQEKKILRAGKASWYSEHSPGINFRTANNEVFDDSAFTCAMWGVPFNQKIKVTNKANGKFIIVRVNDRGPHKRYVCKGRVVDLTQQAFSNLATLKEGLIDVEIEFL